uniref:Uncharacterized protein n=1 Tax=Anguilla anguilla TaxID=7936 RepID=A0A0E9T4N2_ANGAN
MAPMCAVGVV